MRHIRDEVVSMILIIMILGGTITLFSAHALPAPWQGYVKPAFPDYAPSGMPDFDEKQPQFTTDQGHVQYSWCVPVAVADSLWWLDSKYESKNYPNPVPPPTPSDHFNLVTAYGGWDDHDPQNVFGLVAELATYMHTDGIGRGGGYVGTQYADIQPGINTYLTNHGVAGLFEVHGMDFPLFSWIDQQVEACQDVELCLEFWYFTGQGWQPVTTPIFELGHCVTCAGINSTTSQVLVSDPFYNAFEAGLVPGRSPVPHVDINTAVHNNATLVSQDAYNVVLNIQGVPPVYPPTALELLNYLQINGFTGDPNWHAFIRGAVATSPIPVHDVAVTNLTSAKTVICRGYCGNLTVTAQNQGDFTENFNVTVYANTTAIKALNFSLAIGGSAAQEFVWNTTSFAYGNYTLKAAADVVSGETNTANNNFTDRWVIVSGVGDIVGSPGGWPDSIADMMDISYMAMRFMCVPGDSGWKPNADINNDGIIDISDMSIAARNFMQTYPYPPYP